MEFSQKKKNIFSWVIQAAVVVLAAAAVVFGIFRGEVEIVLQKAVMICLECIGLG